MVTKTARAKVSENRSEAKAKSTKVLVCATDFTAEANIRHPSDRSLLDILNNGLTVSAKKEGADFVTLSGVRVFLPDGQDQLKKSSRVKTANILFVAEISDEGSDTTAEAGSRSGNRKKRTTVAAKVLTPSHGLVGGMPANICQQWPEAVESKERFLSLADVETTPKLPNGEWHFRSVAVNRDHVVSVTEHSVEPPAVEMTLITITRAVQEVEADSAAEPSDLEPSLPDSEPQVQDA